MSKRYGIIRTFNSSTNLNYAVVDLTGYPDKPSEYLVGKPDWYRTEMLESFNMAIFPVTARQSDEDSKKRALEYVDYMNRQEDAIQVAIKLVTI